MNGESRLNRAWPAAGALVLLVGMLGSRGLAGQTNLAGMQLWRPEPWQTTSIGDYYGPNYNIDKIGAISLAGCRNACFSGYVVVTNSNGPIEGLKATVTDLTREGGGKIAASHIQIRYADRARSDHSWSAPYRFDRLLKDPPEEIRMIDLKSHRKWRPKTAGPVAMRPIWITVRVPKDAAPGDYLGQLKIKSDEDKLPPVAVRLRVVDWTLADPKDFRIQTVALQSQDAVAKHYGVEMWSDKHMKLLAKSLSLLGEINSRQLAMNLCVDFYGLDGNGDSMVRWIKQPDGGYKYDFTPFDKYLDVAAKTIGKPNLIRLNCWGEYNRKSGKMNATGKDVTLLDPATGKLSRMEQPPYGTEESYKFWKPVIDEALKKLKARGWLDVTAFGHNSYCWPVKPEIVSVAHRLWPKGVWAWTAHNGGLGKRFRGKEKGVSMLIRWPDHIWGPGPGARDPLHRGYRTLFKNRRGGFLFHTMRGQFRANSPLRTLRSIVERNVSVGHDGVSDFGADFFPVRNPKRRNRFYCLGNGRGTGGPNCSTRALLAPGPTEPVATERYEGFREGLQICETILFIQKGINTGKLPAKLLKRADDVLNERAKRLKSCYKKTGYDHKLVGEDSVKRENELFAVAAEVAKALKK
jgi:hypothetical protein